MSIQQNFPNTRPSLNLNFARSQKLDPRITFTRTTSGTRTNSDGLIEVVPANSPRFDFDPVTGECLGLLVEEQRTNNIQVSAPAPADISKNTNQEGWYPSPSGVLTYTSTISPDGNNTAINVFQSSSAANQFTIPFFYNQQSLLSNNTFYTLSFWVDLSDLVEVSSNHLTIIIGTNSFIAASTRNFRLNFNKNTNIFSSITYGTGSSVTAETADTIFPSASISGKATDYPNNYKRIQVTFKLENYDGFYDSGNTLADFRFSYAIYMGVSGSTNSNVGRNLKTWGWQLESGSFSTSYIPTTNTTATRTADNASITGSNFSDFYNPSEGTFITEVTTGTTASTGADWLRLTDGNINNNSMRLTRSGSEATPQFLIVKNTVSQAGPFTSGVQANIFSKLGCYYKNNDFGITNNGSALSGSAIGTSGEVPDVNRLLIANPSTNGYIKRLVYYPSRITNNQLITLTK
jgi:hypothetical protein